MSHVVEHSSPNLDTSNVIRIQFASSVETQDSFQSPCRNKRSKKSNYEEPYEHNSTKKIKKKKNIPKFKTNKENKICFKIFHELKSSDLSYQEFPQLAKIEKNVKNNFYTHYQSFAKDVRGTFSNYFLTFSDNPEKYKKVYILSERFENLYKEYDNKLFTKESKNLIEIKKRLNKLKRELREKCLSNNNNYIKSNAIGNKMKISIHDGKVCSLGSKNALRKFKIELTHKVSNLNSEQKKGIINLISNNYLGKSNNNVMEIDVNKIPINQLKQLDKYVDNCLNDTKLSVTENVSNIYEKEDNTTENNKQSCIFEELSDSLSSDDSSQSD